VHHQSAATRDAGACECPSEDPQTERTNRRRHARRCVLTDIANINAFDAGGSSEWKMHANWSLWIISSAAVTR